MKIRASGAAVAVALLAAAVGVFGQAGTSVRYAAPNENFVPVVGPHNGLGARSAPRRH